MGLMRNIVVEPYSAQWPEMFAQEERALRRALGPALEEIHHIGSTSVPGLAAKPVIDILVVAKSLAALDQCDDQMIALGYEPKGEFGIAGRRFYSKGADTQRTHHLHAFESTSPEVLKHLAFRDYLIAYPAAAQAYAELKQRLARQYRDDIEGYIAGKSSFIAESIERAAAS